MRVIHISVGLCVQLPNCTSHFSENLTLPFDKSRSVARKPRLPLKSSSRTSLSSVLLHNPNRAAAGKCFSWSIQTDLLCLLLLSSSSSSQIAHYVSKGRVKVWVLGTWSVGTGLLEVWVLGTTSNMWRKW